jgi:hypothetical protein
MYTLTSNLNNGKTWTERVTEDAFLETVCQYINWYYKSSIKSFTVNGATLSDDAMQELQDEYFETVAA